MKFADLVAAWQARDRRYAVRKSQGRAIHLTDDEIRSIIAYRRSEVKDLGESDQRLGNVTLDRWTPPIIP